MSQAVQAGIGRLPSSRKRAPTIVSGITYIMPFFRAVTGLVFTKVRMGRMIFSLMTSVADAIVLLLPATRRR